MLNISETQPQPTMRCHFRTTRVVVTGLAPMSLGFPQDAMATFRFIPSGGGGNLWSQPWVMLQGCLSSRCVTCTQSPDLPEPTFLTEKWVKCDSLPGSLWTPNYLGGS